MRIRTITVLGCCLMAAGCSERPTQPIEAPPQFQQSAASSCPTPAAIETLINGLFRAGTDRSNVTTRWTRILGLVTRVSPPPDTGAARGQSVELIALLVAKYRAGALIGGQSTSTQNSLVQLINGILCTVGLPQVFSIGTLGGDGAAGFIYPNTPDTTLVTGTLLAGVQVPNGSVGQPTIVTITRLPDFPGPLLTPLDQYPIYYEFTVTPAQTLGHDVVVGVCLAGNASPPDITRLRVAHNVAPFTPGSIAILPLVPAPFIDCTNAPFAAAPSTGRFDLATRLARRMNSLLLPASLEASPLFSAGGVGGTVKNFSPFGSVDTLASMTANSPMEFHGPLGGSADGLPSVVLRTPTGQAMAGVPVTFALTSGGGSIGGASTVTDVNGVATLGAWILGPTRGCSTVAATATLPAGSGATGSPAVFFGCGR